RLFGVTSLTQTNCSSTWMIIKNQELHWYHHANPILLLVMYYTLATLIRLWLQEPVMPDEEKSVSREDDKEIACSPIPMTAERRRSLWYASHYTTDERKLLSMTQDEYKPSDVLLVTVNGNPADYHTIHPALSLENGPAKADMYSTPQYKWEPSDDVSEKEEEEEEDEEEVAQEEKENVKLHALVSVFQFIMKQSYICALIAMM
ncbi:Piezo-type mechanosensitive ion channel component 2, partial [Pterocles gutturalis]